MNRSLALIVCLANALLYASLEGAVETMFHSTWEQSPDRIWAGAAYWANPLQDWQVRNGRLECIQAGTQGAWDRQVHLLTWQLQPSSTLTMAVTLGRVSDGVNGWAGFRVAHHGGLHDYRHSCIFGEGIDAGISTDGHLLLADKTAQAVFENEILLVLQLTPRENVHDARLTASRADGTPIATLSTTLPSNDLWGNLVLVSHSSGNRREGQFYFRDWQVDGTNLAGGRQQDWGPILFSQYTLSRNIFKLTAQMVSLGHEDDRDVTLQIRRGNGWQTLGAATIDPLSRTAAFRIPDWDSTRDIPYRLVYLLRYRDGNRMCTHEGTVRRDPLDQDTLTVAGFTGNKDYAFPNSSIVNNLEYVDPDMLFFSGDQIYEDVARFGIKRQPLDIACLDYLRKWYLLGWAFGDLMRDRPTVCLPDDHDVYQGNIWGAGGRPLPGKNFAGGGYMMDPVWVNMVQRTQTSHLPDPFDPTPIEQGITVCYTDMVYGRVSFAILEDRKFKTGPLQVANGEVPLDEAAILGPRQLDFVNHWTRDWRGADMKCALSQTVFAQAHTHGGRENTPAKGDRDANGWPPAARNRALDALRRGFAFMLAGDNHLPTIVHHGIDTWGDAGYSFTVPSIAAGFPRAWKPEEPGLDRQPGMPEYTGKFRDFKGNLITMWAAANPRVWHPKAGDLDIMDAKSSGFGLVRFHKPTQTITMECWRLLADPEDLEHAQFEGWPRTINMRDNYGRTPAAFLPEIRFKGVEHPVIHVIDERTNAAVYALRVLAARFTPWVFQEGVYTVVVEDTDRGQSIRLEGLHGSPDRNRRRVSVSF